MLMGDYLLKSIVKTAKRIKNNLTSLDAQPIGKAALTVIVFLDLFILISIFDGLADHTKQLITPAERIPQYCRSIVIESEWSPTTRLNNLARVTAEYRNAYDTPDEGHSVSEQHALCARITSLLREIREDQALSTNLLTTLEVRRESAALRAELERVKGAYDTALLEAAAERRRGPASVDALKNDVANKTSALNDATRKLALLEAGILQDARVQGLFRLLDGVSTADRVALRDDLRRLNFWYPVKRLGMEMLFLLPLFLVFYFWNSRSIAKQRPFQTLVSSHLIVVTLIPVFFKLVELVYDIIPKKLLKHVLALLESLGLVALWHYLLMGLAVLAALALIYLFQKKLFSREKVVARRIAKGLCQNCNQRLPIDSSACPLCGFVQYRDCKHCGSSTHVYGKFCKVCGQASGGRGETPNAGPVSA